MKLPESKLTKHQRVKFGPKIMQSGPYKGWRIIAEVRYDDDCGNGHNTFSITGTLRGPGRYDETGGCVHDEIAQAFPELAPFIKWHLCSSDGPLHYVANTTHHASDRDCWGYRKGEVKKYRHYLTFDGNPIHHTPSRRVGGSGSRFVAWLETLENQYDMEVIDHSEQKTDSSGKRQMYSGFNFGSYPVQSWYDCPFDNQETALRFLKALQTCRLARTRSTKSRANGVRGKSRTLKQHEIVLYGQMLLWSNY